MIGVFRRELAFWLPDVVPTGRRCLDHGGAAVVWRSIFGDTQTAQIRRNSRAVHNETGRQRRRRP